MGLMRHMNHIDREELYTDLEARIRYLHSFLDFSSSTSFWPSFTTFHFTSKTHLLTKPHLQKTSRPSSTARNTSRPSSPPSSTSSTTSCCSTTSPPAPSPPAPPPSRAPWTRSPTTTRRRFCTARCSSGRIWRSCALIRARWSFGSISTRLGMLFCLLSLLLPCRP